jgi:ABC-type transport system involved in cytochrome c biogenesis permease subunit
VYEFIEVSVPMKKSISHLVTQFLLDILCFQLITTHFDMMMAAINSVTGAITLRLLLLTVWQTDNNLL